MIEPKDVESERIHGARAYTQSLLGCTGRIPIFIVQLQIDRSIQSCSRSNMEHSLVASYRGTIKEDGRRFG